MDIQKKRMVIGSIVLLIVATIGVGGFYFQKNRSSAKTVEQNKQSEKQETQKNNSGVEGSGDFKVTLEPSIPPAPSLDRPIVVSDASLSKENADADIKQINVAIEQLKKNSTNSEAWMNLGLYRKAIGDYTGAEEAWLYALALHSTNNVAVSNLADLYARFLKDYPKAEKYYRMFITMMPSNPDAYINLSNLYRYQYKEKVAEAPAVLKEGITKNPNDIGLMVELARLYKEAGNKTEARVYYEKAIAAAKTQGNHQVEAGLTEELKGL